MESATSFDTIDLLFGDLVTGRLFATQSAGLAAALNDVFAVGLQDVAGHTLDLAALSPGGRADIRFFNFADETAGLLLENTGQIFRLSERAVAAIPLPAIAPLVLLGLTGPALLRRCGISAGD